MIAYRTIGALAAIAFLIPSTSFAADTTPAPFGDRGAVVDQNYYHPPEVYVLRATATVGEHREAQGVATFWNRSSDVIGDLTYRIDLLGALPKASAPDQAIADTAPLYDTVIAKDRFVLLPNEKQDIPFTYTPPVALPAGDYRIEVTVSTGRGRTMGWFDVPVTFSGEAAPFVTLIPSHIVAPEYVDGKEFDPMSGPNVTPGKSVSMSATATVSKSVTAIPQLDIYNFNVGRTHDTTITGKAVHVTSAATPVEVTVPISKLQKPGVYFGVLSLIDPATQHRISNLGEFRWVVRGADADILYIRLGAYSDQKGANLPITIDYVGAADAESTFDSTTTIQVSDDAGVLAVEKRDNAQLSDAIFTGKLSVVLPRAVSGALRISATITDIKGDVLADYPISYALSDNQKRTVMNGSVLSRVLLFGGLGLAGVGCVILANIVIKRGKKGKKPRF